MAYTREFREKARQMRRDGMSVRDIHLELGIAKSSVSMWVRDIKLSDEQFKVLDERKRQLLVSQNRGARANREKFLDLRREYQEEGRKRARENPTKLHMLGCFLYWAEGAKQRTKTYFVNSDADMMLLFAKFLREELHISDQEFTIFVRCHPQPEESIRKLEQFWLDLLKLPSSALKITQIRAGGDKSHNQLNHGLCAIAINNVKVTQHIFGAIQEYAGIDKPEWLG